MNCPHCNTPNPDDARFCASCGKATHGTEPASSLTGGVSAATPDPIGKEIAGRYRILAKLGEGGMGTVYKAEQISLKRTCAVKILRPDVAMAQIMMRRFNAEAEAVAKLSHPNTVGIYDFGQDTDGTFFIAMEFVEGKSLREVIHAEAPLAIPRALSIASQVAASLVDAHGHSIIHRDLKPDNVMLQTRGRQRDVARVLDFGIAKLRDEGRGTKAAMTQAGDMLGTPQYMAPEQIRAEQIDGRTDIYALGCMLYEMVTGRLPFEGPTLMSLLSKHLMENPDPPSRRRPELGIPPMIDDLIMQAIAKDPNQRPPTMEAFGERLNAVLATMPATSGQLSAAHSVPNVPPAMGAPGYATPHGQGMYPQQPGYGAQPYQTPPPMGYPTPGVQHAPPMPPPGYGTPQAAYSPYAQPQPGPMPATGGGGGMKILLIVLVVLGLGGAAAAVYFLTRADTNEVVAQNGSDAGAEKKGSDEPGKKPIADVEKKGSDEPDKKGSDAVEKPGSDTAGDDDDDGGKDSWGSKPTTNSDPTADLLDRMEKYKDEICACNDAACVAKVTKDMQQWSIDAAKHGTDMSNMDAAAMKRMQELGQAFAVCAANVGKKLATPTPTPVPKPKPKLNAMQQLEGLANRACGCSNVTCARTVLRAFIVFVKANTNAPDDGRAHSLGEKLGKCLITAGMPPDELVSSLQGLAN